MESKSIQQKLPEKRQRKTAHVKQKYYKTVQQELSVSRQKMAEHTEQIDNATARQHRSQKCDWMQGLRHILDEQKRASVHKCDIFGAAQKREMLVQIFSLRLRGKYVAKAQISTQICPKNHAKGKR